MVERAGFEPPCARAGRFTVAAPMVGGTTMLSAMGEIIGWQRAGSGAYAAPTILKGGVAKRSWLEVAAARRQEPDTA